MDKSETQSAVGSFSRDELQAIDNLAWMVIRSKQNLGTRIKDQADSVRRIIESKKQPNDRTEERCSKQT